MNNYMPFLPCILLIWCVGLLNTSTNSEEILGCGGFVKTIVNIRFDRISLKLYAKSSGKVKYESDIAPNNGYYFIPIYDKGDYILRIEPPDGWFFVPKEVDLTIDGSANDLCSNNVDINFVFKGFTIRGKVNRFFHLVSY